MNRYIEITDEQNKLRQLNSSELPFEFSLEKKNEDSTHLNISKINLDKKNDVQVCAHIAESEGHIFFQPVSVINDINIFHNDVKIEKSVWMKSGDVLLIGSKVISYNVSGDIIQLNISEKNHNKKTFNTSPELIPPPPSSQQSDMANTRQFKKVVDKGEKKLSLKKVIITIVSILLLLASIFILFAETVTIDIKPQADKITLSGVIPPIKINNRYMLLKGQYNLSAFKKGYFPLKQSINIDAVNKDYQFIMDEMSGKITLKINPETNNKIYEGSNLLEKNEKKQYELMSGEHNIVIKNPRYQYYEQIINVEGKNTKQIFEFKLIANWGNVEFTSMTDNTLLEIYLTEKDNNDYLEKFYEGKLTHEVEIELIAGQYIATINKEKFKEFKINFKVEANEYKKVNIETLAPEDASVYINTKPSGSIIRVDGKYNGKTPKKINLIPNVQHEVELSLSGYKKNRQKMIFEPGEKSEQIIDLKMIDGSVFISVIPSSAKLIIDGIQQKESSGRFHLKGKKHRIIAQQTGYLTQSKNLTAGNYSKNISFNLKKISQSKSLYNKSKNDSKSGKTKNNYTNTIKQNMLLMKASNFIVGSKKNESGRGSNERQYKVELDYDFYLSDKEVSNQQFKTFMSGHKSGVISSASLSGEKQPVVNVTWNDAAKFANWLSRKEGLTPYYKEASGKMEPVDISKKISGYRLPFEAEWVLASRGIKQKKYPWADNFPPIKVRGNFADEMAKPYVANVIQGYNDQQGVSAPIGSYKKNSSGFYDMGGNVSEWCQDYYSPNPARSYIKKIIINPTGPIKGSHKVVKDSSWRDASITELRLSYRSYSKKKANDIGFRLARYAL